LRSHQAERKLPAVFDFQIMLYAGSPKAHNLWDLSEGARRSLKRMRRRPRLIIAFCKQAFLFD
jgi:hypothetical protein